MSAENYGEYLSHYLSQRISVGLVRVGLGLLQTLGPLCCHWVSAVGEHRGGQSPLAEEMAEQAVSSFLEKRLRLCEATRSMR